MKLYTLEYSFNKPMQQTITVGTNTDYMIGVSAVKNGELINLQPQDVTLTIGENVLTSEKLINGYVVFDYSQGRKPVSEIVKVTILDTQFELLIVGKFSSKGDIGGSGGVAEETDPVFVEKCLSASSVILGIGAKGNEAGNDSVVVIGSSANGSGSERGVFIGNGAKGEYTAKPGAPMDGAPFAAVCVGATLYVKGPGNISIGANANCDGTKDIAIGFMANSNANNSIAIGDGTNCEGLSAVVIGSGASSIGDNTIAIGKSAKASWIDSIAIGTNTLAAGNKAIAIGPQALPYDNSVAIGGGANAGNDGIAIGCDAKGGNSSIVLGKYATTNSQSYCIVIGNNANANGEGGVSIGNEAFSMFQSIAIGKSARTEGSYSIQLGYGSNSNENTFQVWDHTLLNKETGLIPPERLGTGYDSSQRQVLVNNYGTLAWETYNG